MKERTTIFLSGVSSEFATFRDAVGNQIIKKGWFPENQTNFPPDFGTVEELLRRKLNEADAVIPIIGFRFGEEPKHQRGGEPRRSYTQMEFDIACELQKSLCAFLSTDDSVRDQPKQGESIESDEVQSLQRAHREAIKNSNHLYFFFKDRDELCKLIAEIPFVHAADFQADISRIIRFAPDEFVGRDDELRLLNNTWLKVRTGESPRPRIVTFVALGGEGKTSLVSKWAAELAHCNWIGCDTVFAWSFYDQGTRQRTTASSDLFLKEALIVFGDRATANSAQSAFDKGRRLAQLVGGRRALLVLDGLEPLQYSPTSPTPGELMDPGVAALLKGLAAYNDGLCVVTTRYSIPDLKAFWQTTAPEVRLERLSREVGVSLLETFNLKGSLRKTIPFNDGKERLNEFENLVEEVKGHALTLNLLGSYLRDAYAGDIRKRDLVKLEEADTGHAFRLMDAYVRWMAPGGFRPWLIAKFSKQHRMRQQEGRRALAMLQIVGLFDRPATSDCITALLKPPVISGLTKALDGMSETQLNLVLSRLERARLLTVNRDAAGALVTLDAHPLIREHFARQLRGQQPEAWRAAHSRLYDHLQASTPDEQEPTLQHLEPLYQSMLHGCVAGRGKEVFKMYINRIERGEECYATRKLGAFGSDIGAFSSFFEEPWWKLRDGLKQIKSGKLIGMAGSRLRAIGRLSEAEMAFRASFDQRTEDLVDNAFRVRHVSEILLLLGKRNAINEGRVAVKLADQSGDDFERIAERAVLADALFHFEREATSAQKIFQDAEEIQRVNRQAEFLHSLWGFRFCTCLLERCVKRRWKEGASWRAAHDDELPLLVNVQCRADFIHEETLRKRFRGLGLLDAALAKLCLAVVEFMRSGEDLPQSGLDEALALMRATEKLEFLPQVLLTRAWLRFLIGARVGPKSAQEDLDEAWEVAERGPFRLHMADILLYRARLFFREKSYPWTSAADDLVAAENLIYECSYHRRDEELADAKRAILGDGA